MYFPLSEWLPSFILTVAAEAPIVGLLARRVEPDLVRLGVLFLTANLATHLTVWYVATQLFPIDSWTYVLASEGWAIAAEAAFFAVAIRGLGARRAVVMVVAANLVSFVLGRTLFALWPDLLV